VEESLAYFRKAVLEPGSVPPWSEWWGANGGMVERTFPLFDFVRLKHRRLLGARQMLQIRGELPKEFVPPGFRVTGSCGDCGERMAAEAIAQNGTLTCPNCGRVEVDPG
jgi:hypothetical protein